MITPPKISAPKDIVPKADSPFSQNVVKYYVDAGGSFLGGFAGPIVDGVEKDHPDVPAGATEVTGPPEDARQTWDGAKWSPAPAGDPAPLEAEELYDMLVAKGVVAPADRPRPKPVDKTVGG